ncbi:protein arginine N-methyltransferase 2-like isoform X2 [Dreissena polymorpha]|uniref:protein arginine N-methyltransferase 2-like isoform X2 n=1 Tax=Dreissena polymorpha TaxID=45954 RepID=UPI002264BC9E|nr:protein arginine N-methyltransferase 2-like isoform X2 [Dreissena polymorpha]XP_052235985.1 protein arginine N-methyltransferase 2-like isoform X2 [Dreissena polymorpha]XP_052235987.1 protein arginine N-methyltransferase 2-like isoform X2 [Dreissena polymorpha]
MKIGGGLKVMVAMATRQSITLLVLFPLNQNGRMRSILEIMKLHLEMLSDKPRTEAYMNAIVKNADKLRDKVILDVGCGTGILSMLCVKHARPKHVYAVEASDIAEYTQKAVEKNGMASKITVLNDFAENAKIEDDVDLIISEWMGTMLLFEMMIESVLSMRDRFMKPELTIWPSSASLYLVPCTAQVHFNRKLEFWDCQYGLDFSSFKTLAKEDLLSKPYHDYELPCGDCLAKGQSVLQLDMKTLTIQSLENIVCQFEFVIDQGDTMHGFCTWFEVEFCPLSEDMDTVILNTGPDNQLTHWKQNLFLLDSPVRVNAGDVISGTLTISRNPEYRRHLRAFFDFKVIPGLQESKIVDPSSVQKMFYVWR